MNFFRRHLFLIKAVVGYYLFSMLVFLILFSRGCSDFFLGIVGCSVVGGGAFAVTPYFLFRDIYQGGFSLIWILVIPWFFYTVVYLCVCWVIYLNQSRKGNKVKLKKNTR